MAGPALSTQIIDFWKSLKTPKGSRAGKPLLLMPWQRRLIRAIWSAKNTASMAPLIVALTMGRSGGKSLTESVIATACVAADGPLNRSLGECTIVSRTLPQARKYVGRPIHYHMKPYFAKYGVGVGGRYRFQDSKNAFEVGDKETGAIVTCAAATPEVIMGAGGIVICDEVSSWKLSTLHELIAAIETSTGKEPGSVMLMASTRSDDPSHPFEKFLDRYADVSLKYAVPNDEEEKNIFKKSVYLKSNPSARWLPELDAALKKAAKNAQESPASLASYKALRLNQGGSGASAAHVITPDEWRAMETDWKDQEGQDGPYHLGIDTGYSNSMTAAAAYFPESQRLTGFCLVGDTPSLRQRGKDDNVGPIYEEMNRRGELLTCPGRVSDLDYLFAKVIERWGYPVNMSSDRYRAAEVLEALELGVIDSFPIRWRGNGLIDGHYDLNKFKKFCLKGWVKPDKSLLMRSGFATARTTPPKNGNIKLAKGGEVPGRPSNKRDDIVSASLLAVSAAQERHEDGDRPPGIVLI